MLVRRSYYARTRCSIYLTFSICIYIFREIENHSKLILILHILQGWEETTDAALTFLLRTSLAKVGKENQGATPITLDVAKDTSRIKKHVSSVIDRITKGNRIQDDKNRIEAPSPMEFNTEEDEIGQALNDVHATPIGTQRARKLKKKSRQKTREIK